MLGTSFYPSELLVLGTSWFPCLVGEPLGDQRCGAWAQAEQGLGASSWPAWAEQQEVA